MRRGACPSVWVNVTAPKVNVTSVVAGGAGTMRSKFVTLQVTSAVSADFTTVSVALVAGLVLSGG